MAFGAHEPGADAAEIHAQSPQQPFGIVLGQPEVLLEAEVDDGVGGVIDRHAVRFLAGEGSEDAHPGGHLA